jgi:integrase
MPKRKNTDIKEYSNAKGDRLFRFRLYLGIDPATGKKVTVRRSKLESYAAADALYNKLAAAGIPRTYNTDMTLDALYAQWFAVRRTKLKPASQYALQRNYEENIKPVFGDHRVSTITVGELQEFAINVAKRLVNFRVPINYVNAMLEFAVRKDVIATNPMHRVDIPGSSERKKRDTSTNFLEADELRIFLSAAQDVDHFVYTYFAVLAMTGARMSEALALRWSDFDADTHTILIERTVTSDKHGKPDIGPTKNGVRRRVPLNGQLLPILRKHKLATLSGEYIFRAVDDDFPVGRAKPRRWLDAIYKALDDKHEDIKRVTVHGFRHTYASLMYELDPNITIKDVQHLLGDKTMKIASEVYTHVTKEGHLRTLEAVNRLNVL